MRFKYLSAFTIVLASCSSGEPASSLATLDAFAGRDVGKLECANPDVTQVALADAILFGRDVEEEDRDDLRKATLLSLTSVPDSIQRLFLAAGGSVRITHEAGRLCTQPLKASRSHFDAEAEKVSGCINVLAEEDGEQESVSVVIAADAVEIRHNVVRLFGYFVAQYLPRLHATDGGKWELAAGVNSGFRTVRTKVAKAFLADMVSSKTFDLQYLEPMLGKSAAAKVRANFKKRRSPYVGLTFQHPGEASAPKPETRFARFESFEGYVFADAFDSYFCRPSLTVAGSTRAVLRRDFTRTYVAFENAYKALEKRAAAIVGTSSELHFALQTAEPNGQIGSVSDNFIISDTPVSNDLPSINIVVTQNSDGTPIFDVTGDPANVNIDTTGFLPPPVDVPPVDNPPSDIVDPSIDMVPPVSQPPQVPTNQINGITTTTPPNTPVQQPPVVEDPQIVQPPVQQPPVQQPPVQQPPVQQPVQQPMQQFPPVYPSSGGCGGSYGGGYGSSYWN